MFTDYYKILGLSEQELDTLHEGNNKLADR